LTSLSRQTGDFYSTLMCIFLFLQEKERVM